MAKLMMMYMAMALGCQQGQLYHKTVNRWYLKCTSRSHSACLIVKLPKQLFWCATLRLLL